MPGLRAAAAGTALPPTTSLQPPPGRFSCACAGGPPAPPLKRGVLHAEGFASAAPSCPPPAASSARGLRSASVYSFPAPRPSQRAPQVGPHLRRTPSLVSDHHIDASRSRPLHTRSGALCRLQGGGRGLCLLPAGGGARGTAGGRSSLRCPSRSTHGALEEWRMRKSVRPWPP